MFNTYVAFLRVSTNEQRVTNQETAIENYVMNTWGDVHIRYEKMIGSSNSKPVKKKLEHFINSLDSDTHLIVYELSRLVRSIEHLCDVLNKLKEKRITLNVLSPSLILKAGDEKDIVTSICISAFNICVQLKQQLISERTKLGLQAKKDRDPNFRMGRPVGSTKCTLFEKEIIDLYNRGFTCTLISKELEVIQIRNRTKEDNNKPLVKICPKTLRNYITLLDSKKLIKKKVKKQNRKTK